MALTKENHIGKGLVGVPALVGVSVSSGSDPQMACYVSDREKLAAKRASGLPPSWGTCALVHSGEGHNTSSKSRQRLQRERSYHCLKAYL